MSTLTPYAQLNQWTAEDKPRREQFNQDNLNIDNKLYELSQVADGKLSKAGGVTTGRVVQRVSSGSGIAAAVSHLGQLELNNDGDNNSFAGMCLHREGDFATYLGLDTDNQLKLGGYSMGANAYPIWHAGVMPFEKGTWTPTVKGYNVAGNNTYIIREGYYQRIGNVVTVSCRVKIEKDTAMSGVLTVSGLPYYFNGHNSVVTFGCQNTSTTIGRLSGYAEGNYVVMLYLDANGTDQWLAPSDIGNTFEFMMQATYFTN